VPLADDVADGTEAVADEELVIVTGPVHAYPATFKGLFAVRVSVPPVHIGPLFEAPESEGAALTVADVI